jgi:hypothetical protein
MQTEGKRRIRDVIADWYWAFQIAMVAGFFVLLFAVRVPQGVLWLYLLAYVILMRPARKEVWRRYRAGREARKKRAEERAEERGPA